MSSSNSTINNNNTTSSSTTGGSTSSYKSPFPNSSVQPRRESRFTEHFEYSEWKNMPSVVDHSKHFELMAVPIEHERKEAEEKKKKKSWGWGSGSGK
ncbi:hypothetical protein GE21DRAFT_4280 [Neurospora crassa]|uniref:Uncharacterized protein n=1 Tax=Neurospora crassa (strain ATCC 24698 / 74-OR23-1A / CBS 708.71 / DSM 1257 / FGSC 987) TaxID=367110 RepID=Q7RY96_NEUCR|nr:hypothetical protein NCU00009 [Neurospora crassa OR74A]EAA27760.1 hypothetical protein NCU00009 [Neurospora crassa OR74A]KHE84275.1 hypothetical protein GE21DRAFT_4280 [Neurospora crassa]|eukprot:XP_956996.1 hypothetical protein NCU00009 [Neurospora crassa OR74A]